KTIASGLVDTNVVAVGPEVILCALLGAVIWNLITWWYGLPSSSSHALIGGLSGAAFAAAHDDWSAIIWSQPADPWYKGAGLLWKVVVPMFASPLTTFLLGFVVMGLLFAIISGMSSVSFLKRIAKPRWINGFFGKAQIASAAWMGYAHGLNDAQKTMGIIALALFGATTAGTLDTLPSWLSFLHTPVGADGKTPDIAVWVKLTCAFVMAAGTAAGGWRIIKTLGHKMVKLHPINGFAADTASATVITLASTVGIPVSTTHAVSASIMGVGTAKRLNAIKWTVVERMVWAWLLTIPIAGSIAYALVSLGRALGWF
ncbi:MAG TPA: inorganic phosphate transporter, partial [Xanthomonadales bacterium]|nr:inorganic phosphate transporter [Xanthomonadales bacterium]